MLVGLLAMPAMADEQTTIETKTTKKETTVKRDDSAPAPDNTAKNRTDQGGVTADQGKNNKSDLETARQIRRALVKDKGLSVYAHNVKIIAQNGHVTLKGPVRTADEKQTIESKANEIAGATNVTSEIEIASKR